VEYVITSLQEKGLLDAAGAARAREFLEEGRGLEESVLAADGLGEEAMLRFLAEIFEVPYVDADRLEKNPPSKEYLNGFPARLLLRHQLLPLEDRNGVTIVATSKISESTALDELRVASGRPISHRVRRGSRRERAGESHADPQSPPLPQPRKILNRGNAVASPPTAHQKHVLLREIRAVTMPAFTVAKAAGAPRISCRQAPD